MLELTLVGASDAVNDVSMLTKTKGYVSYRTLQR
jgi:hypothetical protein